MGAVRALLPPLPEGLLMDTVARWKVIDGVVYAHVNDLIAHLVVCSESVLAFCGDSAPEGARKVADTLDTTADSLRILRDVALADRPWTCATCGHAESEHVLSVDRCNHRGGEDVRCTCDGWTVA